jgi:hypothetical protein
MSPQPPDGAVRDPLDLLRGLILEFQQGTQPRGRSKAERAECKGIQGTLNVLLAEVERLRALSSAPPVPQEETHEKNALTRVDTPGAPVDSLTASTGGGDSSEAETRAARVVSALWEIRALLTGKNIGSRRLVPRLNEAIGMIERLLSHEVER